MPSRSRSTLYLLPRSPVHEPSARNFATVAVAAAKRLRYPAVIFATARFAFAAAASVFALDRACLAKFLPAWQVLALASCVSSFAQLCLSSRCVGANLRSAREN